MKVLIIGANGQVGKSLVALCQQNNIKYIATSRQDLDISNKQNIKSYFSNLEVDFVLNATAYTNVELAEDEVELANIVNSEAVGWLATECKAKNIPFIHISTDYVFDGSKAGMYAEDDITNPINVYGASKLDGEKQLQENWYKNIILRVSWVFSEHGNNFVKTMLKLSNSHEKLTVISDQYGAPTSANSIAQVMLDICHFIEKNPNFDAWGIYNYTDFPMTTWHQFASFIISKNKQAKTKEIQPILAKEFKTKAQRPQNSALDVNKIKLNFGIKQQLWSDEVNRVFDILEG
ncbi:dTDP-4-dehydrorhamnose reductase [Pseudofrancisella aestuarii]|uniref:dTDP-4-dehydrorhamnose reductase n=1 Tax=Pseudofrancisella aestuarii TaxID=2670347 RepID=A0ABV9TCU2_9GAMM|nr:dTDP-4-dehydrorhamnose reductase [Pseudofrancisella aestuarii]